MLVFIYFLGGGVLVGVGGWGGLGVLIVFADARERRGTITLFQ